ncbi:MAG: hypothetical protein L0Y64_01585 [Myxococcaceae bacterium]|nr:hypothetical protein [Myxococcaceae bacterium]
MAIADAAATVPTWAAREGSQGLLPRLAGTLRREAHVRSLRAGRWYGPLLATFLQWEERRAGERGLTPSDTGRIIRRGSLEAALLGLGSGTATTAASAYTLQAPGPGALLALPASFLAVLADMALRTLLHVRMAGDLAQASGAPLSRDDALSLIRLHALTFDIERNGDAEDSGRARIHSLMREEAGELEERVGRALLGESVARTAIPLASVVTASVANWRRTRRLGEAMLGYLQLSRVLDDALGAVRARSAASVELLVEGAWFLFTADGPLSDAEAVVLVHLLSERPPTARARLSERLVGDASAWLKRLDQVPARARRSVLHALGVIASVDAVVSAPERKLLEHAARHLRQPLNLPREERVRGRRVQAGSRSRPVRRRDARGLATPRAGHLATPT